jgi:S-adenosylmethionine uptake transporter
MTDADDATPTRAIALILLAMALLSGNDILFKLMAGDYPLHQLVFTRAVLGIGIAGVFLWQQGGVSLLKTRRPVLHLIRALLIVLANLLYFAALVSMPLGAATALFYVAPLFITVLAIPVLGERVGRHRLTALLIGFAGVVVMAVPATDWGPAMRDVPRAALLLPIASAACYAGMQVMTRKLGAASSAVAMTIYIQGAFIVTSGLFYLIAGDGRFAQEGQGGAMEFLLRAWIWPAPGDIWKFGALGLFAAGVGLCLAQAYRIGNAATIASFEYVALPIAILSGWLIFGERPGGVMLLGAALIALAGLYVFARERLSPGTGPAAGRPMRRG